MSTPSAYRTCTGCGGGQFAIVSHENRSYLECVHCDKPPFPAGNRGHLGRKPLEDEDLADFLRRLPSPKED